MEIKLRDIIKRLHKLNLIRHIYAKKITSGFGLYLGQPAILEFIITHDGCTQKQLADEMRITPASIAITAKRMQKAGLIERTTDQNNLRCNKLFITAKGREHSEKCQKEFEKLDKQMFTGFNEEDLKQLCNYLDKLIDNISGKEFADETIFSLIALKNELDKKQEDLKEE